MSAFDEFCCSLLKPLRPCLGSLHDDGNACGEGSVPPGYNVKQAGEAIFDGRQKETGEKQEACIKA